MSARTTWLGDCAVLVEVAGSDEREDAATALAALPGVQVRCGIRDVLVESAHPNVDLLRRVREVLDDQRGPRPKRSDAGAVVTIEVDYGGPDLIDVAAVLGASVDEVVRAHQEQHWRVAMIGFAPGFAYLEPLGDPLIAWAALSRRESPRPMVPGGSVAVAAGMSAVYPNRMPGGWHLIGLTRQVMFDVGDPDRPSLLAPGDRVRFVHEGSGP